MGPSPSSVWSIVLYGIALYVTVFLFIYWPLAYWFLGRPYDKKYEVKYYIFEKGMLWVSPMMRLTSYTLGILLQPYRYKKIKNKLLKRIVNGRFAYQDKLYGEVIDFRKDATRLQIIISVLMHLGIMLILISMLLVLFHNFILYPEVGRASLK